MVTGKPVTGKITGYRFQFSITGYRFTDIFSSRNANFSFSFVSHSHRRTDRPTLDPDIPASSDGSVPFFQVYPVFDCAVCSSPLPIPRAAGKGGREEVQTGRTADDTDLGLE